jgi:hypothetical protein
MLDQPLSDRLRAAREAQEAPQAEPEAEPAPSSGPPELPKRVLLGELLIDKGVISEADLTAALEHQHEDGRPLGQILLEMGVITEGDLARSLAGQHGLDFTDSLRRRLAAVDEAEEQEAAQHEAEATPDRYIVRESGIAEPRHVAWSFLDAADTAFELIEASDPERLEIVRTTEDGDVEQLWSYRREDAADSDGSAPEPAA